MMMQARPMPTRRRLSILPLAVALVVGQALMLAAAPPVAAQSAKELFADATKYYNLGDFKRAAELYRKVYEIKPDAVLLFNIAQSYRLSEDGKQALFFYKSYLRAKPNAGNRAEVEKRIEELSKAQPTAPSGPPPVVPVAPARVEPPPSARPTVVTPPAPARPEAPPVAAPPLPARDPAPPPDESLTARAQPSSDGAGDDSVLGQWWFWAGIGAVVVGAVVIGVAVSGGSDPPAARYDLGKFD